MSERRERDLILAPNEYAYLLDETKGNITNYVGPHKTSLANTDQPVTFNPATKRFERCKLDEATHTFSIAPEGWYLVLKNPAQDGKTARPGTANGLVDLDVGRKVNIPGPVSFAPWPGQMVQVIQGHRLRSNQYLIVRVYDDEGAQANWGQAVIKPQRPSTDPSPTEDAPQPPETEPETILEVDVPDLTMGKLLVIKGTDVSFYIPPTGIEVVAEGDKYVRNAVTLERLEYCILLDENGNKRYIKGPAVVFPHPTETFVIKEGSRKFKAIELNEISGLYIKVIAPYEEDGQSYQVGDELFITGADQMIYFPRPEHAIIRYGDREVNYAVAIPEGEARYVLNRINGQITLQRGPSMFLPDPRKEVIVRRILSPKDVALWYPGNQEALEYNRQLADIAQSDDARDAKRRHKKAGQQLLATTSADLPPTPEGFVGDEFTRRQSFTSPRTITLDTKYEGAVSISVWTGYAVLVLSKTGERKVIAGPQTYLLSYDETLGPVALSTGTPKTDEETLKTVYLRVLYNKVSDVVEAETKDICKVNVQLSYRVNFEGDPDLWFNVENYVKFLTDHMRSLLNHAIRQYGVQEFYANAISIIRNTVLGQADDEGNRPGRIFSENGMRIYDVEVLEVEIGDNLIADLLIQTQHTEVQQTLELEAKQRELTVTQQTETIKQQISQARAITKQIELNLQKDEVDTQLQLNLARLEAQISAKSRQLDAQTAEQTQLDAIHNAELERERAQHDLTLTVAQQELEQRIAELQAEVQAVVNKAGAVSPQLIAALQSFSDKALAESMAESMAPLAILGGKSVAEVFSKLVEGTILEQALIAGKDEDND
ncbi:MAG TPA: hypothetical protein VLL52_09915 [Anaerolineae bacterium]|nr:hypothetical protein [Anaerolineae bacterium]